VQLIEPLDETVEVVPGGPIQAGGSLYPALIGELGEQEVVGRVLLDAANKCP